MAKKDSKTDSKTRASLLSRVKKGKVRPEVVSAYHVSDEKFRELYRKLSQKN